MDFEGYDEDELFTFNCIIERHDKTIPQFELKQPRETQVAEFRTWIQNEYAIPGKLSFHHGGKELDRDSAELGRILINLKLPLIVRNDPTKSIAQGGTSTGGYAVSLDGKPAEATGGFSEGGRATPQGKMIGGKAISGGAEGNQGAAGKARGGYASSVGGPARGGRSTGNQFEKREMMEAGKRENKKVNDDRTEKKPKTKG